MPASSCSRTAASSTAVPPPATPRAATDTDQDGALEISELYRSLRQSVDSATRGRQTPWLVRRNIVGDAPLF